MGGKHNTRVRVSSKERLSPYRGSGGALLIEIEFRGEAHLKVDGAS